MDDIRTNELREGDLHAKVAGRIGFRLPRVRHLGIPIADPDFLSHQDRQDDDEEASHDLQGESRAWVGRYAKNADKNRQTSKVILYTATDVRRTPRRSDRRCCGRTPSVKVNSTLR